MSQRTKFCRGLIFEFVHFLTNSRTGTGKRLSVAFLCVGKGGTGLGRLLLIKARSYQEAAFRRGKTMRLGFHMPISGGLVAAVDRAVRTGCEGFQIFSSNPRAWAAKPLNEEEVALFRQARKKAALRPLAVHLPYLPNLASLPSENYNMSVQVLTEQLIRADKLGADFLVAHPGYASQGQSKETAIQRIALAVVQAFNGIKAATKVTFLLETTSGQRGELGASFEELARMIEAIENNGGQDLPVGVCLDTAHAWGAGYDLARPNGQEKTLAEFERLLGLDRLRLLHLNDSQVSLGSHRDRHGAAGLGRIGSRGLARLVRHPALDHLAGLMETPRMAEEDMARVKRWRRYRKAI